MNSLDEIFSSLSHPTRLATLEIIASFHPTPCSLTCVAKSLGLPLAQVSKHASDLEKKGWITKTEFAQYVALRLRQDNLNECEMYLKTLRKD